jgi:hypothetical protein
MSDGEVIQRSIERER